MPNRAADIMRMMQGIHGAGGANQPVSPYGPTGAMGAPPSPAGRFAEDMDPEALRRLMEMMNRAVGKPAPDTSTLRRGPDPSTLRRG